MNDEQSENKSGALNQIDKERPWKTLGRSQILTTKKGDAALEVCDKNLGTAVNDISLYLTSIPEAPKIFVPKFVQSNFPVWRGGIEGEGRVRRYTYGYVALA